MKRKIFACAAIALVSAAVLTFNSCKKDSDDSSSTPTPTPTPTANQLCDGKAGDATYYPLAIGNKWVYDYNYSASYSERDTFKVTGTSVVAGKTYFNIHRFIAPAAMGSSADYLVRIDASTKDVYYYDNTISSEILLIPGSPALNQSLGADMIFPFITTRTVSSLTATINTGNCTYTNCLKIAQYSSGTLIGYEYYKKGLGLVYCDDYKLKIVDLK